MKSGRENKYCVLTHTHIYIESREMVLMSPFQGGSGDAGVQVGLVDTGRAGRGRMETGASAHTLSGVRRPTAEKGL